MMRAVQRLRLVAADRLELAGLDDAQQAGLLLQAERVDLVEQDGAVAGGLELADLGPVGAGEGALDVAEERALDQVGRLGAAGHRQERLLPCAASSRASAGPGSVLPVPVSPVSSTVTSWRGGQGDALDQRQQRRRLAPAGGGG